VAVFAELLKEALLEDMIQNKDDQFRCIFIAVTSPKQKDVFNRCFEKWEMKNRTSAAAQMDSAGTTSATITTSTVSGGSVKEENRVHLGGELVIARSPQVDEVTLATWLDSPGLDDDYPWNEWTLADAEGPDLP